MNEFSVIIPVKDEAADLERCLQSLKGWAPEIIIVDDNSTDNTIEIAKSYGCKVYQHEIVDFADQRNYAASKASHNWILSLDADEQMTSELKEKISSLPVDATVSGFRIPRLDVFYGKEIWHGGWYPQYRVMFYNKEHGHWERPVHERVIFDENHNTVLTLNEHVKHYSHKTIYNTFEGFNRYTDTEAEVLFNKKHWSTIEIIIRAIYEYSAQFFVRYVIWLGFLDGIHGLIIAINRAFYRILVFQKLYILVRDSRLK